MGSACSAERNKEYREGLLPKKQLRPDQSPFDFIDLKDYVPNPNEPIFEYIN